MCNRHREVVQVIPSAVYDSEFTVCQTLRFRKVVCYANYIAITKLWPAGRLVTSGDEE